MYVWYQMKLFRRLATFTVLATLVGGAAGYHYGLRPNNAREFLSKLKSRLLTEQDTVLSEITTEEKAVTSGNKSHKKKSNLNSLIPKEDATEFQPLPANPFSSIDQYAENCPKAVETSVASLAAYLQKNTNSDLEKARMIYVWITKNIRYDDHAFNTGKNGDYSAEGVLKSRKAVCEGFANLFLALGNQMNLEIEKVSGYAKGFGYRSGVRFSETNHAWNCIKINGQWRVFDATWGEGNGESINGRFVSKKQFDEYWFNLNPYQAIFNHLPENKAMQNIKSEIDLRTYENLPYLEPAYFKLGFDGAATFNTACSKQRPPFPMCYTPKTYVKAISAPAHQVLDMGKVYDLEFYVPRGMNLSVVDSKNNWTYFDNEKGKFKLSYTPALPGKLTINVKYENGGESFHTIMTYTVSGVKRNA